MPRQSRSEKLTQRRYSDEFKSEALALAESVGVRLTQCQHELLGRLRRCEESGLGMKSFADREA
jgi:hypothetical protein